MPPQDYFCKTIIQSYFSSFISNLFKIYVLGTHSGETHLRHTVFILVCCIFIYLSMSKINGEKHSLKKGTMSLGHMNFVHMQNSHSTTSPGLLISLCMKNKITVAKLEGAFNDIKCLEHLVLKGISY